jgi:hypothetical protein
VSDFKRGHFEGEILLWALRWYCRYGVSYRDLERTMGESGVSVDPRHDLWLARAAISRFRFRSRPSGRNLAFIQLTEQVG